MIGETVRDLRMKQLEISPSFVEQRKQKQVRNLASSLGLRKFAESRFPMREIGREMAYVKEKLLKDYKDIDETAKELKEEYENINITQGVLSELHGRLNEISNFLNAKIGQLNSLSSYIKSVGNEYFWYGTKEDLKTYERLQEEIAELDKKYNSLVKNYDEVFLNYKRRVEEYGRRMNDLERKKEEYYNNYDYYNRLKSLFEVL